MPVFVLLNGFKFFFQKIKYYVCEHTVLRTRFDLESMFNRVGQEAEDWRSPTYLSTLTNLDPLQRPMHQTLGPKLRYECAKNKLCKF